jgi:hypothetical protein
LVTVVRVPVSACCRQIEGKNQFFNSWLSQISIAGKAFSEIKLLLNNNYHLAHHDLPHVPWFALKVVYETSHQQYVTRCGGFLVKGYSEWIRRYAFTAVAHPVVVRAFDTAREDPLASDRFAGKLRVNFMAAVGGKALHEAHPFRPAEREATEQALQTS